MPLPRKHILRNSTTLLRLGVPVEDIERTIGWVDKHLPAGADAATWIPTEVDLRDDGLISEAAVQDARLAFYGDKRVPRKYKRLLDARSAE